jgi:hypothetical protein
VDIEDPELDEVPELVDIEDEELVPEFVEVCEFKLEDELVEVCEFVVIEDADPEDIEDEELVPEFVEVCEFKLEPEFVAAGEFVGIEDEDPEEVCEFVGLGLELTDIEAELELQGESLFVIEFEDKIVLLAENVYNLEGVTVLHCVVEMLYCPVPVPIMEFVAAAVSLLVPRLEEELDPNADGDSVKTEDLDGVDEEDSEGEFPFVDIVDTDELPVIEIELDELWDSEAENDSIGEELMNELEDGLPDPDIVC